MVKDMTPREEQQGTGVLFVWSTIAGIAVAVGLVVWFFMPGFSQSDTSNLATNGAKSNETQGSSVTAQVTKPVPTTTPRSTDPSTVGRNERLTASSSGTLTDDQISALKSYVDQHGGERIREFLDDGRRRHTGQRRASRHSRAACQIAAEFPE